MISKQPWIIILITAAAICTAVVFLTITHTTQAQAQKNAPLQIYAYSGHYFTESIEVTAKYIEYFYDDKTPYLCTEDWKNNRLWFISFADTNVCYKIPYPEPHNIQYAHQHITRGDTCFYMIDGETGRLYDYRPGDSLFTLTTSLNELTEMVTYGLHVWGAANTFVQNTSVIGDSLLSFPVIPNPESNGRYSRHTWGFPATAFYHLKSGKVSFSSFLYPDVFSRKNYGLLRGLFQLYDGKNSILYYSPAFAEVYRYNLFTGLMDTIPTHCTLQTREIPHLNYKPDPHHKDTDWKHFMLSDRYGRLHVSPDGKYYYRLYFHAMEEKNEDGYYNTVTDKRMSVMVMDENFKLIHEVTLPKEAYYTLSYAEKEGFSCRYINPAKPLNEAIYMIHFSTHELD